MLRDLQFYASVYNHKEVLKEVITPEHDIAQNNLKKYKCCILSI